MKKSTTDTQYLLDDFFESKLLTPEALRILEESSAVDPEINPAGAILHILNDYEVPIASLTIDNSQTPPCVLIEFAGASLELSLPELKSSI